MLQTTHANKPDRLTQPHLVLSALPQPLLGSRARVI
jgi:hypothetical protein